MLAARASLTPCLLLTACVTAPWGGGGSGPYLQDVRPTRAVIAAITSQELALALRWGPAGGELSERLSDAPTRRHRLALEGLEPDTRYAYRLEEAQGGALLSSGWFRTAPVDPAARCVALVVGDSGGVPDPDDDPQARNQQEAVVRAMLAAPADLVLHTGDVVYPDGAEEDYPGAFFAPFGPLLDHVPLYPTLGNHDLKRDGGAAWFQAFALPAGGPFQDRRAYALDWGCLHAVCLDVVASDYRPGSPQRTWLERDLAASAAPWKVVFFHYPPLSPHGPDQDIPALRDELHALLRQHGVALVLAGHHHAYARFLPRDGVTYVVSGGGGRSLYPVAARPELACGRSTFHFLRLEADPERLLLEAFDREGQAFDRLELRR